MNESEQVHGSDRRHGLLPPRALLLSLLIQIPLVLLIWPPRPGRFLLACGMASLTAGVVLNVWAERLFRRAGVGVCPFSEVPNLVAKGPYRFTRNPMYLGLVLISASGPLITGLLWNLWPGVALAIWLHIRFVLPEEDFLRQHLGVAYLDYASRTARWFGSPGAAVSKKAQHVRELPVRSRSLL
jgi:protein-S-isoprenylcysteine O-methyltransferase Ste14